MGRKETLAGSVRYYARRVEKLAVPEGDAKAEPNMDILGLSMAMMMTAKNIEEFEQPSVRPTRTTATSSLKGWFLFPQEDHWGIMHEHCGRSYRPEAESGMVSLYRIVAGLVRHHDCQS